MVVTRFTSAAVHATISLHQGLDGAWTMTVDGVVVGRRSRALLLPPTGAITVAAPVVLLIA